MNGIVRAGRFLLRLALMFGIVFMLCSWLAPHLLPESLRPPSAPHDFPGWEHAPFITLGPALAAIGGDERTAG